MNDFYMKQREIILDSVELFASPFGTLIIRTLGMTKEPQSIEISKEFLCQIIANGDSIVKAIDENNSSFMWN